MTSPAARFVLIGTIREESGNGDVQDFPSSLSERAERLARSAPTDVVQSGGRLSCDPQSSDETLLSLTREGDGEALSFLFRRYARLVRGVAYKVLRDPSEADDLLQDFFILIQRKCGMFDPGRGPARFWILQMAYHSALARRRYLNSRHFYTRVDLEEVENELTNRENGIGAREYGHNELLGNPALRPGFEGLSEDQRKTLGLFFVEGYTLQEIATKLNQTHGNVKHHYFRGLEKLRKHAFNSKLRGNSAV